MEETTTNALVSKATIGQNQSQELVEPGGLIGWLGRGEGVGKAGDMSISFRDNDHISTLSIYIYKHINDISEYIRSQSVSKRSAVELGVKQTTYH